ncbi:hypothetical protein NE237_024231 [Protea cynaroides]|uniref:Uncharacterized protein n=1 Tax=Protea cynaroides TaxID=273540 RepID=A0A9Q0K647_9MAGN|nr:hypothetical protein NE237_024231 [Protea cynaroides]
MTVYGDKKTNQEFPTFLSLFFVVEWIAEMGGEGDSEILYKRPDPNAKIEFRPNTEDDPHKRKPDISRPKSYLLGWEPTISLRKGLPLMVSNFRQRIFGDLKEGANPA